jgi:hypothetical protein
MSKMELLEFCQLRGEPSINTATAAECAAERPTKNRCAPSPATIGLLVDLSDPTAISRAAVDAQANPGACKIRSKRAHRSIIDISLFSRLTTSTSVTYMSRRRPIFIRITPMSGFDLKVQLSKQCVSKVRWLHHFRHRPLGRRTLRN